MSVPAYDRLVASDVLTEEDPVELIEGWLVKMMPTSATHDTAVTLIQQQLQPLLPDGWYLRIRSGIETDDSKPEPDVAVVRGPVTRYRQRHPRGGDIALLVEVAETSLSRDRQKAEVYAKESIPHYWIMNLRDNEVECYSDPDRISGAYRQCQPAQRGDELSLIIDQGAVGQIPVDSVLL